MSVELPPGYLERLEVHFRHHLRLQHGLRATARLGRVSKLLQRVADQLVAVRYPHDIATPARVDRGVVFLHNGLGSVVQHTCRITAPAIIAHGTSLGDAWNGRDTGSPTIGPFTMIGQGAAVLGSVRIGPFAAVGARSLVLCDVPPLHVATGSPATIRPLDPDLIATWFLLEPGELDRLLEGYGLARGGPS